MLPHIPRTPANGRCPSPLRYVSFLETNQRQYTVLAPEPRPTSSSIPLYFALHLRIKSSSSDLAGLGPQPVTCTLSIQRMATETKVCQSHGTSQHFLTFDFSCTTFRMFGFYLTSLIREPAPRILSQSYLRTASTLVACIDLFAQNVFHVPPD